jgi:C4-dicarboxylate-specific signal transduction histidine kinase
MLQETAQTPIASSEVDAGARIQEVTQLHDMVRALQARIAELEAGGEYGAEAEERLRRTEEEARETRERLAHVARISTLGEMATGIAHEINQPLAAVATYAQACGRMIRARTANDVDLLQTLDRISHEALRAGAIINKLKDLVRRRDSGQVPCDLNSLVRDVAGLAAVDAQHNGLELRLSLADDLHPVVADPVQIQQVILNLVRNGIESMDGCSGQPIVMLRTRDAGEDGVSCSVVDLGVGVAKEQEEELFAPFYSTKESGMGMGLSISRTIIRAHGGRLWFTTNPDCGTTFHFTLPVEEVAARGS